METGTSAQPQAPVGDVVRAAEAAQRQAHRATPAVSLSDMRTAITTGQARPLGNTVTDIVRYRSAWWLYDRDGWFQADDPDLIADLDAAAQLMAAADRQVRRRSPTG